MEHKNQSGALPKRSEIDNQYKWDLTDMYETTELWEADYTKIHSLLQKLADYSGTFPDTAKLHACLTLHAEISMISEKLFCYARMHRDEDNSVALYQGLTDRASVLLSEIAAASAFIEPEILELNDALLKELIAHGNTCNASHDSSRNGNYHDTCDDARNDTCRSKHPDFSVFAHFLDNLLRIKQHTLTAPEEKIIAMTTEFSDTPGETFSMLNNADIKFPTIQDENGNDVELTKGRYIQFLESKDRTVRQSAFSAMYDTYSAYKNTLASMLSSNVKTNSFYAKVKKYPSVIESSLNADNVSVCVYDNLIKAVRNALPSLHKYFALRKKALGLDELHLYDMNVPFIDITEKKYTYEEAQQIVLDALQPLGTQYIPDLKHAFSSGWIDVYENQGKTSGAYSWGAYMAHPYVLLNFQGTLNDVFTLAHEMGHALHSYYTNNAQHYVNSHYKIFVAEVASTVDELLLMDYFLKKATNPKEKAYFLSKYIDDYRATVFRQVMFAEFEKNIHAAYESGEPLTCDHFCETYYTLNQTYYGKDVAIDDAIAMEWARIPHFYSSFYVYKYATGFSAAAAISDAIRKHTPNAVENYMDFLQSGGSDYPIDLLKKTGVDLSTPAPIESALHVFDDLVSQLETLL